MQLRRVFLLAMIACLSAAALGGVLMLLTGRSGELMARCLMTMLIVGGFSAVALAAADAHEKRHWRPVMAATLGLHAMGVVLYLAAVWGLFEVLRWNTTSGEVFGKVLAVIAVWSVALPLGAQVQGLKLAGTPRLLRLAGIALAMMLAVMITAAVLGEIENPFYYRLLGVVAILAVLASVTARIMQRVQGLDRVADPQSTRRQMQIVCPRCLLAQTVGAGASRCRRCRLRFTIEIEEPRCPHCDYLLFALQTPRCPECGGALAPDEVGDTSPKPSIAAS